MKTMQFRWDVYLLTHFFTKPAFKLYWVVDNFMKKYELTMDDYLALKRVPRGFIPSNIRVEPFVANAFSRLSRIMYDIGIDDVFDVALRLKNSNIDTKPFSRISMIERKEYAQAKSKMNVNREIKEFTNHLYESQKASNKWHVAK
jgi:hypothetical protein